MLQKKSSLVTLPWELNRLIYSSLFKTLIRKSNKNWILWQSQWRLGSREESAHRSHSSEHYSQICNERESEYFSGLCSVVKTICSTHPFSYAVVETLHEPICHCALPRRIKLFPLVRFVRRSRHAIRTPILGPEAGDKLSNMLSNSLRLSHYFSSNFIHEISDEYNINCV